MTINYYNCLNSNILIGGDGTSGTATGYALDSDFTLGTAGDCVGIRFVAPPSGVHVHSVYWFLHAANATSHNLICHLTGYNSSSSTRANTTAIRSVNAAGGTTSSKWIKFDFSAYSDALTAGELYWIAVGDAAGNGSGYSIRTKSGAMYSTNATSLGKLFVGYTSDNGFSSSSSSVSAPVLGIIVFSDGSVVGMPYTVLGSLSNTTERGLKFIFDEKVICSGMILNSASANTSTIQIYTNSTIPGGTVWSGFNGGVAYSPTVGQKNIGVIQFPNLVTFEKNTYYRMTIKLSVAHQYPGWSEVEDYATLESDALKTLFGAGSWCYTKDNGSNGWIDYNNATDGYRLPRMSLVLGSQVEIPTGGGGTGGGVWSFGY